jgi:hypothetical protein
VPGSNQEGKGILLLYSFFIVAGGHHVRLLFSGVHSRPSCSVRVVPARFGGVNRVVLRIVPE